MMRSFLLLAFGLYATPVAFAADPPAPPPAAPAAPWANKFFMEDAVTNRDKQPDPVILHNFGEVPHGTLCVHKFKLTNIYDTPMQITEVRKSCTCLEYVPLTRVLMPNETTEFIVSMNTAQFVGVKAQNFYVTFGPKYVSTAVLRVQAHSRTDVSLTPGAISFGTVAFGTKVPPQAVKVEYKGKSRDWKIIDTVPPSGPFEVKVSEPSRGGLLRGGVEYQVEVSLKQGVPSGTISDQLTLRTNDSTNPIIQIPLNGTVVAPLEVTPNQLRIEGVAIGQSSTQRVLVRAARPFRVLGVDGAGEGVTAELPQAAAPLPVQVVTIKFEPGGVGSVSRQMRIRTDLDGGATVTVQVEAVGVK